MSASEAVPIAQVVEVVHELAHACDPLTATAPPDASVRAARELTAESVAYIVGTRLGIDLEDASIEYVTSWGGSLATLEALADHILQVAITLETLVAGTLAMS